MRSDPPDSRLHVSALYLYPVKGLAGLAVATAEVDALGIMGDRRFLVVDADNRFLTQRGLPRMALIQTALTGEALLLSANGHGSIQVPRRVAPGSAPLRSVTIWKSEGLAAEDCGNEAAQWLSDFLSTPARLVRVGDQFRRPVLKPTARPEDIVAFPDVYPFMAIGEATLADLNRRLQAGGESAVPMNRFRPSFVVAGSPAFAEDNWTRVQVGDLILRTGGACARCIVTTIDQQSATVGKEPLRLLSTYRRDATDPTRINFGQNFYHETKFGRLRVGDPVTPLPAGPAPG